MQQSFLRKLAVATALTLVAAVPAKAADAIASTWNPGPHPNAHFGYTVWADLVSKATDGSVTYQVFTDGALLPPRTTMQGVRDGVAQTGFVYPPYAPAEHPRTSMLVDLMFVSTDAVIADLAWSEVNFFQPSIQAEWKANGGVFGGGYTTPVYNMLCAKPMSGAEAYVGAKLRTGSVAQTAFATYLGAVPISVPFPDVYSGLQRGSIDCVIGGPENLGSGYKLAEVTRMVTTMPMGVVAGALWVHNPAFWSGLTADQRRGIFDASAEAQIAAIYGMEALAKDGIEASRKAGAEVAAPAADLDGKLEAFKATFVEGLRDTSKANGIDDADTLIDAYLAAEKRWADLLAGVDRNDQAAVAALVRAELYDKVDVSTYGQ